MPELTRKGRRQTFGSLVRKERARLNIGLREMARQIGVDATYLSKIERDQSPPPAEEKVTAIAQIIGVDRDELLALAGKVSADLKTKIMEDPRVVAGLIREFSMLREDWEEQWDELGTKVWELRNSTNVPINDRERNDFVHRGKSSSARKSRKKEGQTESD